MNCVVVNKNDPEQFMDKQGRKFHPVPRVMSQKRAIWIGTHRPGTVVYTISGIPWTDPRFPCAMPRQRNYAEHTVPELYEMCMARHLMASRRLRKPGLTKVLIVADRLELERLHETRAFGLGRYD